jgi:hypothetical protein
MSTQHRLQAKALSTITTFIALADDEHEHDDGNRQPRRGRSVIRVPASAERARIGEVSLRVSYEP